MNKKIFFLLIILSATLRFGTLFKLLTFTPDEEYLIYIANTIIKNFHIIWIGVSSLGFDLYMGPFWIYFISPFLWITKGDPRVLGFISSLLGVATTALIFIIGSKFFNKETGTVASILHSTSALIVYNDQKGYPYGVSTLACVLALSLLMTKYSKKWWIIFAVAFGFVFHFHLSLLLTGLVGVFWLLFHKSTIDKKYLILSFFAFILTVSPLIVFDYFHKASNISVPIRIIGSLKERKPEKNYNLRFTILSSAVGRVLYLPSKKEATDEVLYPCYNNIFSATSKPLFLVSLVGLIPFVIYLLRKKTWTNDKSKLLVFMSLAFLIPFTVLSIVNPVEYYLQGFFPFLFLIIGDFVSFQNPVIKRSAYIIIVIISILGITAVLTAKGDYGMDTKKNLVAKVMDVVKDETFALTEEGGCQRYGGWRYLFIKFGKKPTTANEDKTFSWLYPDEISSEKSKYNVVINERRVPIEIQNYKYKLEEGGFDAYIY